MAKLLILIPVLVAIVRLALASDSEERFLEQPLDHFNDENTETWTMVCYNQSRLVLLSN